MLSNRVAEEMFKPYQWTFSVIQRCRSVVNKTCQYHKLEVIFCNNLKSSPVSSQAFGGVKPGDADFRVSYRNTSSPQRPTSNQISFIYTAQNHNHIASAGLTNCTVSDILCPQTIEESRARTKRQNRDSFLTFFCISPFHSTGRRRATQDN